MNERRAVKVLGGNAADKVATVIAGIRYSLWR